MADCDDFGALARRLTLQQRCRVGFWRRRPTVVDGGVAAVRPYQPSEQERLSGEASPPGRASASRRRPLAIEDAAAPAARPCKQPQHPNWAAPRGRASVPNGRPLAIEDVAPAERPQKRPQRLDREAPRGRITALHKRRLLVDGSAAGRPCKRLRPSPEEASNGRALVRRRRPRPPPEEATQGRSLMRVAARRRPAVVDGVAAVRPYKQPKLHLMLLDGEASSP